MNKDQRNIVVEYASTLSDEDLRFLSLRLHERMSGDLPDALNLMSKTARVDEILQTANSATELFDMLDKVRDVMGRECKRRGVALKSGPNNA